MTGNGKRLFLMRHAEAENASEDKARPLSDQGMADAAALGQFMHKSDFIPDLVLCSSAQRTKQTLAGIQKTLAGLNVNELDRLYSGSAEDYVHILQETPDEVRSVLVVGHNPSIYAVAHTLSQEGARASLMQRLTEGYNPGTLSVLDCACDQWMNLKAEQNPLIEYVNPTDYNAPDRPTRWM